MIRNRRNILSKGRGSAVPAVRSVADVDTDLDKLQRLLGSAEQSAATLQDLKDAGVLVEADGKLVSSTLNVSGVQKLQTFLKGYK